MAMNATSLALSVGAAALARRGVNETIVALDSVGARLAGAWGDVYAAGRGTGLSDEWLAFVLGAGTMTVVYLGLSLAFLFIDLTGARAAMARWRGAVPVCVPTLVPARARAGRPVRVHPCARVFVSVCLRGVSFLQSGVWWSLYVSPIARPRASCNGYWALGVARAPC
jgi:hypothetical protein